MRGQSPSSERRFAVGHRADGARGLRPARGRRAVTIAGAQTGAITGGTGKYRDAAGQFTVEFLSGGEANITFFLDD